MTTALPYASVGFSLAGGQVTWLLLVLMRTTGLVVTAPLLGHRAVPNAVKAGLAAVLALALAGGASAVPDAQPAVLAAPIELLIGACLGMILTLGFHAIEIVGRILALQMGLSLGAVFSPTSREEGTALDPLFAILAGLLFLALNLHTGTIRVLAASFEALPLGGGWPADLWLLAARMTALAMELGARVGLPLVLILLLVELSVALLARAIPQINVFILGLPIKVMAGITVTALALPNLVTGGTMIFRFLVDGITSGVVR